MPTSLRGTLILIGAAIALIGGAWWAGTCAGESDAVREAAEAEAEHQARIVAGMVDSLLEARREAERVDTVIRTILTSAPPPRRPVVPPLVVLDTAARDTLIRIIHAQEAHIDTLSARLTLTRAALDTAARAFGRYRLFADSTIASQGRQIVAMQVVIDHPPKRSPVGLGACAGVVAVAGSSGTGPGACVGVTYSVSLSSLWPF